MVIVAGNRHLRLATELSKALNIAVIVADVKQFNDGELRVEVRADLRHQHVVILQSLPNPVNDNLITLLLMANAIKAAGAKYLTAFVPYLGYSRQDKAAYPNGPISAHFISKLIETSGIDRLVTVDLHSNHSKLGFQIPIHNLDPTPLFLPLLQNTDNSIVVSPDLGGVERAKKLSTLLKVDMAFIHKNRMTDGNCSMSKVVGNIKGKYCIIIDDMVDTGGTLQKSADFLLNQGAKSLKACITHAVCQNGFMETIAKNFEKIYITDTIDRRFLSEKIEVVTMNGIVFNLFKKFFKS